MQILFGFGGTGNARILKFEKPLYFGAHRYSNASSSIRRLAYFYRILAKL